MCYWNLRHKVTVSGQGPVIGFLALTHAHRAVQWYAVVQLIAVHSGHAGEQTVTVVARRRPRPAEGLCTWSEAGARSAQGIARDTLVDIIVGSSHSVLSFASALKSGASWRCTPPWLLWRARGERNDFEHEHNSRASSLAFGRRSAEHTEEYLGSCSCGGYRVGACAHTGSPQARSSVPSNSASPPSCRQARRLFSACPPRGCWRRRWRTQATPSSATSSLSQNAA